MRDERRRAYQLARLEETRRRCEDRLEQQRQRLEKRLERMRGRVLQDSDEPSDTQQRIVSAALDLLNEDGLNNLSLRKLAAKLDMQAPALYWHFKSKDVLIDYMAEAILQAGLKDLAPRAEGEPWQDWLIGACQQLRRAMLAYRDGGRIVAGAHLDPAISLIRLFEVCMGSLTSAGLELGRADLIITTAVHFVFGNVIEEQAAPTPEEIRHIDFDWLERSFPLMTKSIHKSLAANKKGYDEFEDALRLIVGESDSR